jgi:hypothetical protein
VAEAGSMVGNLKGRGTTNRYRTAEMLELLRNCTCSQRAGLAMSGCVDASGYTISPVGPLIGSQS